MGIWEFCAVVGKLIKVGLYGYIYKYKLIRKEIYFDNMSFNIIVHWKEMLFGEDDKILNVVNELYFYL